MHEPVIVSSVRTAVGRAGKGTLKDQRPDDLAATAIKGALARVPALDIKSVDDVILGCAMPEAEQGMNVARIASLVAGIPHTAAAMTVNRFCSSGLQAIALAVDAVAQGRSQIVIAGGTESMSLVPMGGHKFAPNPTLLEHYPDAYLGMGLTAELVAKKYGIGREQSDAFALASHQKAVAAIDAGRFKDEIVPFEIVVPPEPKSRSRAKALTPSPLSQGENTALTPSPLSQRERGIMFEVDEGPRRDTDMAALAKLKPAFAKDGIVTAGNSSPMSDGAAATIVMSMERARELGLTPLARLVSYAVAGVPPEIMGIGPVEAIPKALKQAGLTLDQIDLIELNEAFAAQALAVIQAAGLDPAKVNVNGGAVALGHPLGCTGAKLMAQMLSELKRRNGRYGLVTMCIGGGMGAAGIVERLS
jgi:acetyl-CoA acyltransferase